MNRQIQDDALYNDKWEEEEKKTEWFWCFLFTLILSWFWIAWGIAYAVKVILTNSW